ncbi:protein DWD HYPERSENSITIVE TO UV-B 1 isoform X2 [Magnolia sinica]|nr:protein DWD HYPERSENSITIVE TO UV-B 1 isoform X2 [Magnolia sinica]
MLSAIDSSEIDAVDMLHGSPPCILFNGESVVSLIRAVNQKLRVVDLQGLSFGKDFLRDLFQRGLTCQVLNLRSSHIRKLDMSGKFMQLHTLNLDFSISLTSFREGCFSCMPNLVRLSLCETRVTNLWTTSAALSKLPSLAELRFQNCLCCEDTRPCPTSSDSKPNSFIYEKIGSGHPQLYSYAAPTSIATQDLLLPIFQYSGMEDSFNDPFSDDDSLANNDLVQSTTEESSDESELDFSIHHRGAGNWVEALSNSPSEFIHSNNNGPGFSRDSHQTGIFDDLDMTGLDGYVNMDEFCSHFPFGNKIPASPVLSYDKDGSSTNASTEGSSEVVVKKFISHHPSPICFEKHYREYMVASLPHLKVLDNLPIKNEEREKAKVIVSQDYELLPYNKQNKESIVHILQKRETGTGIGLWRSPKLKQSYSSGKSQYSFSRSISAAKVGSSAWPLLHPISKLRSISREETKNFRPRQFEYHPSNPCLMVFGTLDGELVVINHESGKLVGYLPSVGALHSILGLSWLKSYPSKLIAGSDNGSLQLYDICQMPSTITDRFCSTAAALFNFDDFEQLTSVHVNSTDEWFLASGYSKHVALYDIGSGRRLQVFKNLHREHINVVKFAHHSPSMFATSSFDQDIKMWDLRQGPLRPCYTASSSRGNVMVCFSPDDHYLLSSAVDNEVNQLLAVDGRLHMKFNIASTGSAQNYTRSYYMNGRDYIISGSCEENVVRICCAKTGRRLRDISLEGRGSKNSLFVQSLRGDPFRDFHMSVLAAYLRPSSKSEIIKVNLLASGDYAEYNSYGPNWHPSYGKGG